MTRHISTSRLQRFRVRALPAGELTSIVEHLDVCNACTQQFTEMLKSARGGEPLKFTLAPEFQTRHEHVDYEQLVRLADKTMDASQREMTDVHLKICAPCQEDVRSFLAFREKIEREMNVSYVTIGQQPAADVLSASVIGSWRGLVWKPIYAAAVVLIGIAIIIGAAMLLNRRASNQQVQHQSIPSISPDSHPDNRAAHSSPSLSGPNESRTVDPNTAEATIVISDRTGTITVDKSGNVTGLDDVPASTRDEIVKVLSSEQLERPAILKELGGQETGLRGNSDRSPFKLVSPSRTVIITDSPILKWEKAAGATSYRVYINDLAGHVVKKSDELSSETTDWKVTQTLKRGEIYVWSVVAIIDGREVISPGAGAPEMKFQVLALRSLEQLKILKKSRSHLALGVFSANAGLTLVAHHEFRELRRLNPKSRVANKLLKAVSRQVL